MTPQQQAAQEAASFVTKLNDIILFPLIALLSGVALLVFLYGCAQYIMNAANDQAREEGKKHITFGIIGLVIMVSAFSILTLATGTFGLDQQLDCANDPTGGGCGSAFQLPVTGP
jgi:heme/copper-type cytochrome/quinol oxidase subunit 2